MAVILKDVSFKYKNKVVLKNINAEFSQKKISVIKGANGAGKTTLSKLIMGIEKDFSGEIIIFNKDVKKEKVSSIAQDIFYVFQNPSRQLFCETVLKEIQFALEYRNMPIDKVEFVLNQFNLLHLKDEYPINLSGGEKQRLILACAVALNPKFLILDEPTSSLDKENINNLISILKSLNMGMIIISHDKYFTQNIADVIYELDKGELYARR